MTDDQPAARCPEPGCPIRYRQGPARRCPEHRDDSPFAAYSAHKSPWKDRAGVGETDAPQPDG